MISSFTIKIPKIEMNIYLFVVLVFPIYGFAITAKVSNSQKSSVSDFTRSNTGQKISAAKCKRRFKSVQKDLSKSRPVNKLTIKILLKYCMTETRLKLLASLSSKAKKDSLRW